MQESLATDDRLLRSLVSGYVIFVNISFTCCSSIRALYECLILMSKFIWSVWTLRCAGVGCAFFSLAFSCSFLLELLQPELSLSSCLQAAASLLPLLVNKRHKMSSACKCKGHR